MDTSTDCKSVILLKHGRIWHVQYIFYIAVIKPFVTFCVAVGCHIDLGLSPERLLCLYNECLELASYYGDKLLGIYCCFYTVRQISMLGKNTDTVLYLNSNKMQNHYTVAVQASKMFITLAEEFGDKDKEMVAHLMLIDVYQHFEKHEYAILHANKCLDIAAKTASYRNLEVELYWRLGFSYHILGNSREAVKCCKRYIELAQLDPQNTRLAEMNSLYLLALELNNLNKYDDAIVYGEKCFEISMNINDAIIVGKVSQVLANAYFSLMQFEKSLFYSKKAIEVYKECDKGEAYLVMGIVLQGLKRFEEAINCAMQCNSIAQDSDDKNLIMESLLLIAKNKMDLQLYNDAIQYANKCIEAAKESGDRKMESNAQLITGIAYQGLCQYDTALSYFTEGLEIAEQLADDDLVKNLNIYLSNLHSTVGIKGIELSEVRECCKNHEKVRQVLELFDVAQKFESQGEYGRALSVYEQAEKLVELQSIEYRIKMNIARMNCLLRNHNIALRLYHKILCHSKEVKDKLLESDCHYSMAEVFATRGALKPAENCFREAIKCFETMFHFLGKNDKFKIAFVDKYIHYHETLTGFLLMTERYKEALVNLDCYRARALKSQLIMNYGMKQDLHEESRIQFTEIESLISNNKYTIVQYFASKYMNSLIVFLLERGSDLIVVEQPGLFKTVLSTQSEDTRIEEKLEILLNRTSARSLEFRSPENKQPSENVDESSLNSALEILYSKLLRNVMPLIKQEEIVFLPDGPLFKIPFAALRDPETGRYLSEMKRIRIAPSISTLKILNDRPADFYCKRGALIIGDPLVGKVIFDGQEREITPLFMAYIEALAISKLFYVEPLSREKATKAAVLEKLHQGVSVVHIAAHGDVKKATILLAPSPEVRATKIPDEEDYVLTMDDVQNSQVRAKLVVLSCCQSGRGEIRAEGVVGMCRAFLAAGARAVVASLWSIDDDATREFMIQFYLNLREKKSATLSLQLAMEHMRGKEEYNQPKYWAPFFLMGDDVTIDF